jgi:hypothetical protein
MMHLGSPCVSADCKIEASELSISNVEELGAAGEGLQYTED